MGGDGFGDFQAICEGSTLPVCNLFNPPKHDKTLNWGGCELKGIPLSGGDHLRNLGAILLCGIAIAMAGFLLFRSERKKAAVGRREMQLFLAGYIVVSICEIFTVGGFDIPDKIRIGFTAVHIGAIIATAWILMLNAVVGYQLLDDGTPASLALILGSAAVLFVGTGFIALDTGFDFTGFWSASYDPPYKNYALYVLYQLAPLLFMVAFYVLETILVLRVLGETRPMIYITVAAVLFAIGQVFNYTISEYICDGTNGKIDGSMFETLFTLLSVVMVWIFWSSITEDDWPVAATSPYP